jgi:hypothetical protein
MTAIAFNHRRSNRGSSRGRHLTVLPDAAQQFGDERSSAAPRWSPLVIRLGVGADDAKLRRLAHLDSARPLSGQTLLAEQGGSIVAALSLDDGAVVADPFTASADAVTMLRVRAGQLSTSSAAAA